MMDKQPFESDLVEAQSGEARAGVAIAGEHAGAQAAAAESAAAGISAAETAAAGTAAGVPGPDTFWLLTDPGALPPPSLAKVKPVLERLGPSPFPQSRFPFVGFLATLYDHIAEPWQRSP